MASVRRGTPADYPLVSTNVYEARWTEGVHASDAASTVQLFRNQTVTLVLSTTFISNALTDDGQLPDGRPGTLIGAYVRSIEPSIGVANALGNFEALVNNMDVDILVDGTRIWQGPGIMLPAPARLRVIGATATTVAATNHVLTTIGIEGKGIPFEPHPINENEGIEVRVTTRGITTAAHDLAFGLVVTDARPQKKMVA